jgi:hypothetical protein
MVDLACKLCFGPLTAVSLKAAVKVPSVVASAYPPHLIGHRDSTHGGSTFAPQRSDLGVEINFWRLFDEDLAEGHLGGLWRPEQSVVSCKYWICLVLTHF